MLSLSQKHECNLRQKQALEFPERVGEIPLFSLHKIKTMSKNGIYPLPKDVVCAFFKIIIAKNARYKEEIKRDWNCITPNHVIEAITLFDTNFRKSIKTIIPKKMDELTEPDKELMRSLIARKNVITKVLKEWFEKNFDFLLYDTSSNIPWAIVQELRMRLNVWVFKNTNSFGDEIEGMIFNIAKKQGVSTDGISAEDAWKAMGGKLFTE